MTVRVVVVGLGKIGKRHLEVYRSHPGAEVVGVCDVVPELAAATGKELGVPWFSSVGELLAGVSRPDAASVATAGEENGGDHYAPTMELLGAGVAVLGEKPISNRIEEAREMVELASKAGVCYGINLNHRFTPAARRARAWLEEGRLGEVSMLSMRMWINNPKESSPWFHLRALHSHSVDLLRYMGGDIARVAAFAAKGAGRSIWSNLQAALLFDSGAVGTLTGSYDAGASYGLEHLEVVGSEGRLVIENACEELSFFPRRSIEVETIRHLGGMRSFNDTFEDRIGRWVDQLEAGASPEKIEGSGREGLAAQEVVEAAIASCERGEMVSVPVMNVGTKR